MKPIHGHLAGALAITFTIAACVPSPDSTPAPGPVESRPASRPMPAQPPSIAMPSYQNWIDAPQSPGDWTYRAAGAESRASFMSAGRLAFQMICTAENEVVLVRPGTGAERMGIRTETSERAVAAESRDGATIASLSPREPLLDAMALTRGRFAVETAGSAPLYLPAWAEVTRVIEDCR